MRALHSSALAAAVALALGGCSRQPPPMQPAPPCIDLKGAPCAVGPDVGPSVPSPGARDAGAHRHRHSAAKGVRHKRPRHHVGDRQEKDSHVPPRMPQAALAAPAAAEVSTPPAKWTPPPAPPAVEQPATRPAGNTPAAPPASASNATVQEQVAVATALAERITALSRLPVPNKDLSKDLNKDLPGVAGRSDAAVTPAPNRLVVVLMVRPGVRAVSELRGRVVAIDERYVSSRDKLSAAMAAAGAADVQLMQGQGTAINRLTNGEVAAAIVALVVPEASDAFPEIAGFRIFRIPLPTI